MTARALLLSIAVACAVPAPAPAAPPPPSEEAIRARGHFQAGSAFYAKEMYAQAIAEFEAAWDLAPMPDILFNLGQAHRLGGNPQAAIRYYKKFLNTAPRGPAAAESHRHVQELEDKVAREERERLEQEQRDKERAEQERIDKERLAQIETERREQARLEGERLRVEGERLRVEREQLVKERLDKERALAATRAAPPPVPLYKRWWPWTLAGVAVAAGVGVGLGVGLAPGPEAPGQATDLGTFRPFQ